MNLNQNIEDTPAFQNILNVLVGLLEKTKTSDPLDPERHIDIACNICKKIGFKSYRYKCLECSEYDLCSECFEQRKVSSNHKLSHPMIRFESPKKFLGIEYDNFDLDLNYIKIKYFNKIHNDIKCKGCHREPIRGIRFKCDTCYDYDLCFSCYSSRQETQTHSYYQHPLVVEDKSALKLDPKEIEMMEEIGSGAFGTVYKSRLKSTGKIVACKRISLSRYDEKLRGLIGLNSNELMTSYMRELESYTEFKCENIVKMIGNWIENTYDGMNLYVVTEYMEKKSLFNLLEKEKDLTLRRKLSIANDIVNGMVRIHDRGFIHRDIRPDNILIGSDYTAKIGDFGIAKLLDNTIKKRQTLIGCQDYMPPEFYTGHYDLKLDIYTFGLTLVELFDGEHTIIKSQLKIKVVKQPIVFNELINACLATDVKLRPDAKQIRTYLNIFSKMINKYINENVKDYSHYSLELKNQLFKKLHD
ncbi:unnamed protein product, partial [Brachionus calyciflorus]